MRDGAAENRCRAGARDGPGLFWYIAENGQLLAELAEDVELVLDFFHFKREFLLGTLHLIFQVDLPLHQKVQLRHLFLNLGDLIQLNGGQVALNDFDVLRKYAYIKNKKCF